jgi:apolipoprotein N-acyltransferase
LPINVSVVQGNVPQDLKWDANYKWSILDKYAALTRMAAADGASVIVWPETSIPGLIDGDKGVEDFMLELARDTNSYILAGAVRVSGEKDFNSAYLYGTDGELLGTYDKVHLVPFGEFIPMEKAFPWIRNFIDKPVGDYSPGKEHAMLRIMTRQRTEKDGMIRNSTAFYDFGVLICFEDIFPEISGTTPNEALNSWSISLMTPGSARPARLSSTFSARSSGR